MNLAIVGSGIAGLGAARALLDPRAGAHRVTVFEAAPRPGGHVYTVNIDGHAIDLGFIVCNRARYPLFCALLDELGIATRPTTMAFSVVIPGAPPGGRALEWSSASLSAMFADRSRIASPAHWRFLARVTGFLRRARHDLGTPLVAATTLDEYLAARRISADVRDAFVIPLAAALWSLAPDRCGTFPAETYLRFLDQHGMLDVVRPLPWRTVVGGSARYVDALLARLHATGRFALALSTPIARIARDGRGVTLERAERADRPPGEPPAPAGRFDRVIVATHADTALALLDVPSADEHRVLGAFRYSRNRTVLHRDPSFLPSRAAAHAAWNYVADPDTARVAVTYSMTALQGVRGDPPYLVTLNPRRTPCDVLHEALFDHPQFDRAAIAAQPELASCGAAARTYYAGAHAGFGFHEDGLRSGIVAATRAIADEGRR